MPISLVGGSGEGIAAHSTSRHLYCSPLPAGEVPWLWTPPRAWLVAYRRSPCRFESWLAFTAASTVLLLIPGPTVLLVVSYALGQGWRTALPMAVGVALGDFTAMTLSMLGVGALLAASATVFTALKWIGAAYLVWLGIKLWRAGGALDARPRTDAASSAKMLAMPGWSRR